MYDDDYLGWDDLDEVDTKEAEPAPAPATSNTWVYVLLMVVLSFQAIGMTVNWVNKNNQQTELNETRNALQAELNENSKVIKQLQEIVIVKSLAKNKRGE